MGRQRPGRAAQVRVPGAKKALAEIWGAEGKAHARAAVTASGAADGANVPQAVAKSTDDLAALSACCDYPAGHRVHRRTTNPIEPAVATIRPRSQVTMDPGSRAAGPAMAFTLFDAAQGRWRAVGASRLVALVRTAAAVTGGTLIDRPAGAAA